LPEATIDRTHSAPVRLFPQPLPARMSHVRQPPSGGSCSGRARRGQYVRSVSASALASGASTVRIHRAKAKWSSNKAGKFCGQTFSGLISHHHPIIDRGLL